jgi:putative endonuclease
MTARDHAQAGPWDVYIVETVSGKLYTGITIDVERRFQEHSEGRLGAKFFRMSPPARIVFRERHPDRAAATVREREIKGMSRRAKLALLRAASPVERVDPPFTSGD